MCSGHASEQRLPTHSSQRPLPLTTRRLFIPHIWHCTSRGRSKYARQSTGPGLVPGTLALRLPSTRTRPRTRTRTRRRRQLRIRALRTSLPAPPTPTPHSSPSPPPRLRMRRAPSPLPSLGRRAQPQAPPWQARGGHGGWASPKLVLNLHCARFVADATLCTSVCAVNERV